MKKYEMINEMITFINTWRVVDITDEMFEAAMSSEEQRIKTYYMLIGEAEIKFNDEQLFGDDMRRVADLLRRMIFLETI